MRLRTHDIVVRVFDPTTGRWIGAAFAGDVERAELSFATYNVWNDPKCARARFGRIAELLARNPPDVMVFQEVTSEALDVFLDQPWIRDGYCVAAVAGGAVDNYGMLMLSRLPIRRATYSPLPTRAARGFLRAELAINGAPLVVCSVHLDSGKRSRWLRGWQLRILFHALRGDENAVVMGDFNMRDDENGRIAAAYRDVWPALRPDDDGYTEDTSINLMRYDMKNKHRQVRFDRVLVKGDRWEPTDIDLLGTEPLSKKHPRVFPSDHFGVLCRVRGTEVARAATTARADERRPTPRAARAQ